MNVLPFHDKIVDEMLGGDGVLLLAKGLGLNVVILRFIERFLSQGQLLILLNVSDGVRKWLGDNLRLRGNKFVVRSIDASDSVREKREKIYRQGGVLFAMPRTIITDMLMNALPAQFVQAILVNRCHTMTDTSIDTFAIREYRRKNRSGCVKGFTDCVEEVVKGYSTCAQMLRRLRVSKLFLWPRNRVEVQQDLERKSPEVYVLFDCLKIV